MNPPKRLSTSMAPLWATPLKTALFLVFTAPVLVATAAEPTFVSSVPAATNTAPAQKCMSELRVLDGQMETDAYWLHGSGFGYGYPSRLRRWRAWSRHRRLRPHPWKSLSSAFGLRN